MPKGYKKDGTKLGFKKGHKLNVGVNNPNYKHGKTTGIKYCLDCRKLLSDNRNKRCLACDWVDKRKHGFHKGKNNPAWVGGFKEYPAGWRSRRFKEFVISSYKYKRQLCDKSEKKNGQRLHLHHIDYNRNNLDYRNLIPLCRSCHAKTNFNRKKWITYFEKNRCHK